VLACLLKFLEGLLYFANSPSLAANRLNPEARAKAEKPSVPMPGILPDAFYKFSSDMIAETVNLVHPKNVANHAEAGKAGATVAIKQHFSGTYREYYEPQWERARQFMVALSGAKGALDPAWLTSDTVKSANREATSMLKTILAPIKDYEITFNRPADRPLSTIIADIGWGDWTPADFDKLFELFANAFSLGLKIAAAAMLVIGTALTFTPLAAGGVAMVGAGGGVLVSGGISDRLTAALRVAMVAFLTMPSILGSQFDVMRIYSLAYQAVFHGVDISDATDIASFAPTDPFDRPY